MPDFEAELRHTLRYMAAWFLSDYEATNIAKSLMATSFGKELKTALEVSRKEVADGPSKT